VECVRPTFGRINRGKIQQRIKGAPGGEQIDGNAMFLYRDKLDVESWEIIIEWELHPGGVEQDQIVLFNGSCNRTRWTALILDL
jgi:hypothetical protein